MTTFDLGPIHVSTRVERGIFDPSPGKSERSEIGTFDAIVSYSHSSGWKSDFSVVNYPQEIRSMGLFTWSTGQVPPFDRLDSAGKLSVLDNGESWICAVRALRKKTKPWPILAQVTEEELDSLLVGSFKALMQSLGVAEIGRYGDMVENPGKNAMNGLGLITTRGNIDVIAAMVGVTRPLALVKGL